MGDAPEMIKRRHIGNCYQADPAYGRGVAVRLGLEIDENEMK
jgi:catalase